MGRPKIRGIKDGPLIVSDLEDMRDGNGQELAPMPLMSLCRCGNSDSKPYCDGSHKDNFSSGPGKGVQKPGHHIGEDVTIHFHTHVCSGAGHCSNDLPEVFRKEGIDPDGAIPEKVIEIIRKCPSGALACTINDEKIHAFDRNPRITISKDGPIEVEGNIAFEQSDGHEPVCPEHYCLCRCGESENMPYCDANHLKNGFKE